MGSDDAYWARVRDASARELWLEQQYSQEDYEWAGDFVHWHYKNSTRIESAWLLHCEDAITSPCISACDALAPHCPACGRTLEEKREWKRGADRTRKKLILANCEQRLSAPAYAHWQEQYARKKAKLAAEANAL